MRRQLASLGVTAAALSLLLGGAALAGAGNNAAVDEVSSGVPASGPPGSVVGVRVRVVNTGDTTWRANTRHRLGANPANQLVWSAFPCGGYVNSPADSRVYLCRDVAPGQSYDFQFGVTLPSSGSAVLSVRMVQDGVEWFGETQSFTIGVASGCANSPLTTPSDRWKLEIFGNRALTGSTVEQRYDAVGAGGFSFDWGTGRPSSCTGVDNFGIRFSRTISVAASGDYRFTTTTDDGVRLWVDGQLLIDRWVDQAPANYTATKFLAAGTHDVRMDYYENGGGAVAALRWDASSGTGEVYGINVDPPNPAGNPSPDDLKALGARWVRIEWKASRGPAFYDPKIRSYRDAGLKVLVIVDYATVAGKPNGTTGTDADWVAYIATFVSGVRSLAQHVGDGVDAWQIWNEPDLLPHPGYDPYVPAHQYGVMLRDTAAAIRSHSSRPVVTAGLLRRDSGYLTQVRTAAGGLPVDAVVVHPYGQRAPDNWPWSTWGFGNMSNFFDMYLAFGKPLWVSEIGLSTQDSEFQGQYLENVYRLVEGEYAGRVQVVFWFCWSDGMVSPFGVVDGSGKPKPAYYRYQTIAPRY